jgi:hypothetical protein
MKTKNYSAWEKAQFHLHAKLAKEVKGISLELFRIHLILARQWFRAFQISISKVN